MRSLFKRKNNNNTDTSQDDDQYHHDVSKERLPTPPMGPIDPDGSTASHSSNDMYIDRNHSSQRQSSINNKKKNNSIIAAMKSTMTASQFKRSADSDLSHKRNSLTSNSAYTTSNTSALNLRSSSTQGKHCQTKSRNGVPIITSDGADYFSPSAVSTKKNYATDGFYSKSKLSHKGKERPKSRPSARESAFGGAPRYDWMDIETTAAIKIQAIYRRIQVQNYLDANNLSTPGMRNRRAQRNYQHQQRMSKAVQSADVPFPFNLCGVGLLFGDGTMEDDAILTSIEKKKMKQSKLLVEREDEGKRKFRMRKKESQHMEEGIEVVEN